MSLLLPCLLRAETDPLRFDVRRFGAVGEGVSKDTAALTRAIGAAAVHGGTVVLSPGRYVTGTLELRSGITLELQAGAVLEGSPDMGDYGTLEGLGLLPLLGQERSGEGKRVGMLVARNAHDINIVGEGAIDGGGDGFFDFNKAHHGPDYDAAVTRDPDALRRDMERTDDGPVEVKPTGRPGTMILFTTAATSAFAVWP